LREVISQTPDCSVLSEKTEAHNACYVFYYQSNKYISSGKLEDMYVGHGPVIVCRKTSEVFETGSSRASLEYIDTFKACGDPNAERTDIVEVFDWREGANKVEATKLIKSFGNLDLADAKNIVDSILEGHPASFKVSDLALADEAVSRLINMNFSARRLWSNQRKKLSLVE